MEAEGNVRPVKLKDLPKERQAEVKRLAGVPSRGYPPERAERVSNSIPASWTDHRKACGWAGTGECLYCGDEGEQNMWKRLDESISLSEKLASLSWPALGTWTYLLSQTDTMGRFPRDARIVKAKCMTMRYDVRLELVEEALLEIEKAGLLHRYDVDGKAYLVLHDYPEFNPPGALGKVSPKYPAPPEILCKCLQKERANGVRTPDVTSPVLSTSSQEGVQGEPKQPASSPEGLLVTLALAAKVIHANERQLRTYISGWLTDKGFQYCEQLLMNPAIKGKDVFWIHETYFKLQKNGRAAPGARRKVVNKECAKCNGTGRRLNPATNLEMDCGCVREVAV